MDNSNAQVTGLAPRVDPFIGLREAIGWVATRDEASARAVADARRDTELSNARAGASKIADWIILIQECEARGGLAPEAAFSELSAAAAIGDISSRGRNGAGGFQTIPADDWIDAELEYGADPDAFKPAGSPGWIFGTVWTHVRFIRPEVMGLWPAKADGLTLATDASKPALVLSPQTELPEPPKKLGRRRGLNYEESDKALVEKMRCLIAAKTARSVWPASALVVGDAEGAGTEDSKRRRLVALYRKIYPV